MPHLAPMLWLLFPFVIALMMYSIMMIAHFPIMFYMFLKPIIIYKKHIMWKW